MTVVSLASVKGAPGVTTLACLLAAAWPIGRRVVVVENDPSGCDLAARFRLSAKQGWTSFASASRRLEGVEPLERHLQRLPGGLEVLIGGNAPEPDHEAHLVSSLLVSAEAMGHAKGTANGTANGSVAANGTVDLIADLGRLQPGAQHADPWLERSTVVALVVRRDPASIIHLRNRSAQLRPRCRGRIGLVVIGAGPFSGHEIEQFVGLPLLGELPDDPHAAQIAGGAPGGTPRLSRSLLVLSARRLAAVVTGDLHSAPDPNPDPSSRPHRPIGGEACGLDGGHRRWYRRLRLPTGPEGRARSGARAHPSRAQETGPQEAEPVEDAAR